MPGQTIQLKRAEGNEILIRHRPLGTLGEVKVTVQVGDPRRDFMPLPGKSVLQTIKLILMLRLLKRALEFFGR